MSKLAISTLLIAFLSVGAASAAVIADWTFETSIPANAGPFAAELGDNAATSFASGFHVSTATVWSSPAGNGSPHSFSSNNWSINDWYQFTASTVGYTDITFGWDQTRSNTGPMTFDLAWSLDGTNFNVLVNDFTVPANLNPPGFWNGTTYIPDYTSGPLAAPAALNNQPIVYFRLINQVTPGGSGGTYRVDNVVIGGTVPEPATLTLLALGGLAVLRRR